MLFFSWYWHHMGYRSTISWLHNGSLELPWSEIGTQTCLCLYLVYKCFLIVCSLQLTLLRGYLDKIDWKTIEFRFSNKTFDRLVTSRNIDCETFLACDKLKYIWISFKNFTDLLYLSRNVLQRVQTVKHCL